MKISVNSTTDFGVVSSREGWTFPCVRVSTDGGNSETHLIDGTPFESHTQHTTDENSAFLVAWVGGKTEKILSVFRGK